MSNGIQNKMLTYEAAPPPGVWNKIAAALDESEVNHPFSATLYEAEVVPPIGTWNKIQTTLDAEQEVAVEKRRQIPRLLRYAVAAVLIGLVAWGGFQLFNTNKTVDKAIVKTETTPAVKDEIKPVTDQSPEKSIEKTAAITNVVDPDEARNDAALEASKKTFAKLEMTAGKNRLKNIASAYRFSLDSDIDNSQNSIAYEECPTDLSRYITMMTREGKLIRISKKLGDLACCVSGEDETKDCKDQISRWREKIACSPTGHSTGSFLDILSLVSSLQDQ